MTTATTAAIERFRTAQPAHQESGFDTFVSITEADRDALIRRIDALTHKVDGYAKECHAVEQALGKALGYPWFKDDPAGFPDATEDDGVCVAEHAPATIAREAADRIAALKDALSARAAPEVEAAIERVEAGLEGVTPGPWYFETWGDDTAAFIRVGGDESESVAFLWMRGKTDICDEKTGDHIASCDPDTIRAILANHRALVARVAELEATLSSARAANESNIATAAAIERVADERGKRIAAVIARLGYAAPPVTQLESCLWERGVREIEACLGIPEDERGFDFGTITRGIIALREHIETLKARAEKAEAERAEAERIVGGLHEDLIRCGDLLRTVTAERDDAKVDLEMLFDAIGEKDGSEEVTFARKWLDARKSFTASQERERVWSDAVAGFRVRTEKAEATLSEANERATLMGEARDFHERAATKAEADLAAAYGYASRLLQSFVNEHFGRGVNLLPNLLGVLTQIDNATTIARDLSAERDAARASAGALVRALDRIVEKSAEPARTIASCAPAAYEAAGQPAAKAAESWIRWSEAKALAKEVRVLSWPADAERIYAALAPAPSVSQSAGNETQAAKPLTGETRSPAPANEALRERARIERIFKARRDATDRSLVGGVLDGNQHAITDSRSGTAQIVWRCGRDEPHPFSDCEHALDHELIAIEIRAILESAREDRRNR